MKMTNDIGQFLCDGVNQIILCFEDGYEITIGYLLEWDFDFNKIDISYIDFKTAVINKELFNRFCTDDCITFLHIEAKSITNNNKDFAMIDIPCNMRIRSLRTNGDLEAATEIYVQLEGMVK